MRVRLLMTVTIAAAVAACSDVPAPVAGPGGPSMEILDGAHGGGNRFFYFLPPMVSNPRSGVNVTGLSPVVAICSWTGAHCEEDLAHFTVDLATTTTTQPGNSETVRESSDGYIVNWHTTDFNLVVGALYRVRVRVNNRCLGHADVDVVGSGKDLKNVDTGEYIPLLDDRTLPIKFRIEDGALSEPEDAECEGPGDPI